LLLHSLGFGVGYVFAKWIRYPEEMARTVSIEVGMQNGGLAAVLARANFPLQPLIAIPAVFSSLVQNLIGSLLAAWWRTRPMSVPAVSPAVETLETP
jgi:bile acid:Na+ symporter, BASS family